MAQHLNYLALIFSFCAPDDYTPATELHMLAIFLRQVQLFNQNIP